MQSFPAACMEIHWISMQAAGHFLLQYAQNQAVVTIERFHLFTHLINMPNTTIQNSLVL